MLSYAPIFIFPRVLRPLELVPTPHPWIPLAPTEAPGYCNAWPHPCTWPALHWRQNRLGLTFYWFLLTP